MAFSTLRTSIRLTKPPFPTLSLSTIPPSSVAAQLFYTHLLKTPQNPEKTLATIAAQLDTSSVSEVIKKCSSSDNVHLGLRFFVWAGTQSGFRHTRYMYEKACKLLEIDRNPDRISGVLEGYRVEGCFVSVKVFKVLLSLCREAKAAEEGLLVLRKMSEFGCRPDTTVYNGVIRLLCGKGEVDLAAGLMKEMGVSGCYPDVITYMEMVKVFCGVGRIEEACDLIEVMKGSGLVVNAVLYSALLDGVCRFGFVDKALELLDAMEKEGGGCTPNVITYTSAIQRFVEKRQFSEAFHVLDRMEGLGCAPNRVTVNAFVTGLCAEGLIGEAHELVHRIAAGGSVMQGECYSSLVLSLLRVKRLNEAEKLFTSMLTSLVKPDRAACSCLIRALCLEGRAFDGFNLYGSVEETGYLLSIDSDVYALLLDGLCKQNYITEATKLASLMVERKICVKSSCIEAIISHLNGSHELDLISTLNRIQDSC